MKIKGLLDCDFVNYKKPCMVVEFNKCDFKCDKECGECVCQNSALATAADIETSYLSIVNMYIRNEITQAICFQGLEPFDSWTDMYNLIKEFRKYTTDDIVIYTGYNENEIEDKIKEISIFKNIIIKFGRFIPNQESHYDEILGVKLASNNQYAKKIS